MVEIKAGIFLRGSKENEVDNIAAPQRPVYLDQYYLDQYEVTVAQFRQCVEAEQCSKLELYSPRCNWGKPDRDRHPMNCIQWNQARQYCSWVGKRLPTEAEWEKAARGTDGRDFPWGDEPASCKRAVMRDGGDGCGKFRTWPIGSKSPAGDSPYGIADLAGNVMEWVADWFGETYYRQSPEKNPPGPEQGKYKVARGGSWYYVEPGSLRTSSRLFNKPEYCSAFIGFRCAADQPPAGVQVRKPPASPASAPTSKPSS